jgi:hypothetical protein
MHLRFGTSSVESPRLNLVMFETGRWQTPEVGATHVAAPKLSRIETSKHRDRRGECASASSSGESKCMEGVLRHNDWARSPRRGKGQERNGSRDSLIATT